MAWLSLDPGADRSRVLEEVTGIVLQSGELANGASPRGGNVAVGAAEVVAVGGAVPVDLSIAAAVGLVSAASAGMLLLTALVAVAGMLLAGWLGVRERLREQGLLRALGLERPGLRRPLVLRVLLTGVRPEGRRVG